jgi:hypothetical protein
VSKEDRFSMGYGDEAIQAAALLEMDCFAPLAMTGFAPLAVTGERA